MSSMAVAATVGQAIVYLRPLRHMLDVETSVSILNDDGDSLGILVVQLRPSLNAKNTLEVPTKGATKVPSDVDDLSDDDADTLNAVEGSFLYISVAVHVDTKTATNKLLATTPRSAYGLSYAFFHGNTMTFPLGHTHTIKVLVTSKLVEYVSSDTLTFSVVSTKPSDDSPAPSSGPNNSGTTAANTGATAATLAMHNALLEELQRDKAKMVDDHELEKQRNQDLRNELTKLIDQVKAQEDAMVNQLKSNQQHQAEVARLQEKTRADAREKEQLVKQLNDADTKYQTLVETATAKSKTCSLQ
ncbi:hypothetical protein LEN26_020152 [Aphanomyces euteiches]|nr:hypothetical protein LEN26_020152 [Aphanomyces euteiches]KAH9128623.1 hypothetical protein AeMF1_001241 [Aphanomyces euteiches]KAH9191487.1 hypothetical protein AeNC1_006530 [Aphanomyces euteiches]